jgi:hypothetical protein
MTPLLGGKEDLSSYHVSHNLTIYTVCTSIQEGSEPEVARHLAHQQGENLYLVQRHLRARGLGRFGGAQRLKKCPTRACGLEGLDEVLRRGEINPARLDQLGARLVSESVPHHAYDLLLGEGLFSPDVNPPLQHQTEPLPIPAWARR